MMRLASIAKILQQLAAGEISSRELVERCLGAIADAAGEGSRTFVRVYDESARCAADAADDLRRRGGGSGALLGVPISIKDLFDVAGETTRAGSLVLADAPAAREDAAVVRRLKDAGAVLMGRTGMTEFAYSGLGLNPHYGTPRNPYDRANSRIPGGSSSGAAISVSDGMAAAAIGSDTGGSVRIPAALCGLTGFKPTARRISPSGMLPLSPSLDSIGPLARTVGCCARVDAVLAGEVFQRPSERSLSSLRLGVLQGYVLDGLDAVVSRSFERALTLLGAAGTRIESLHFEELVRVPAANQFASAEAYSWHRRLLARDGDRYDPHVSFRIRQGSTLPAADYLEMLRDRQEIIQAAEVAFSGFDAVLLPTTARMAPELRKLEADDAAYFEANGAMLRNPSLFNFLDGCALSVPCHAAGEPPTGLMIAGLAGWDSSVLSVGSAVETKLAPLGGRDAE